MEEPIADVSVGGPSPEESLMRDILSAILVAGLGYLLGFIIGGIVNLCLGLGLSPWLPLFMGTVVSRWLWHVEFDGE